MFHWIICFMTSLEMFLNIVLLWMYILDWEDGGTAPVWAFAMGFAGIGVLIWFVKFSIKLAKRNIAEDKKKEDMWKASMKSSCATY